MSITITDSEIAVCQPLLHLILNTTLKHKLFYAHFIDETTEGPGESFSTFVPSYTTEMMHPV